MRDGSRRWTHVPDEAVFLGGIALMAAAVPLVCWSVEELFRLFG